MAERSKEAPGTSRANINARYRAWCPFKIYSTIILYIGTWLIYKLKFRISTNSNTTDSTPLDHTINDSSGLTVISPQKAIGGEKLNPCILDGVGELQTSWVGQRGVRMLTIVHSHSL